MPKPLPNGEPISSTPRFYLIERQRMRPGTVLLAMVVAAGGLGLVGLGMRRDGQVLKAAARLVGAAPAETPEAEDKYDPNQVDTIYLGDPSDAPVPARRGNHVSDVHPTIIVRLPRYGDETGLIPNSPAGKLLYGWLAAFNQSSYTGLESALPTRAPSSVAALEMKLRLKTGGYSLLSAKEVQPGLLVFRLRDQTPEAVEVLGTLQVREGTEPAEIGSFSLREIPAAEPTASAPGR